MPDFRENEKLHAKLEFWILPYMQVHNSRETLRRFRIEKMRREDDALSSFCFASALNRPIEHHNRKEGSWAMLQASWTIPGSLGMRSCSEWLGTFFNMLFSSEYNYDFWAVENACRPSLIWNCLIWSNISYIILPCLTTFLKLFLCCLFWKPFSEVWTVLLSLDRSRFYKILMCSRSSSPGISCN